MSTHALVRIIDSAVANDNRDRVEISPPAEVQRGGSVFIMDFHGSGNSGRYRVSGWSGQEDTHVWTLGDRSTLSLPPPIEHTPLILDIDVDIGHAGSWVTAALIRIFANDVSIGAACATGRSRLQCPIPAEVIEPGKPIEVRFEHPCYARVDYIDLGKDDRVLGLCFYAVAAYPPWLLPSAENLLPRPEGQKSLQTLPLGNLEVGAPSAAVTYRFGKTSNDRIPLNEAWRFDEAGNAWAAARECQVEVPAPDRPGHYVARFDIVPLRIRTLLSSQRMTILLNGAVIGQFQTGSDTLLNVPLPPELIEWGGTLRFGLLLPDGAPIHDFDREQPRQFLSLILDAIVIAPVPVAHAGLPRLRVDDVAPAAAIAVSDRFLEDSLDDLPAAVHDALGIEMSDIMRVFESLGDNCAFGLAQRKANAEVLGILRFANSPLKSLMRALEDEFKALAEPDRLEMRWVPSDPGEFMLSLNDYGLRWHTNVFDASVDQATLFTQQSTRLSYLRRKFYEGLKAGRKIFTISRAEPRKHPIPMPDADAPTHWEEKPEPLRWAEVSALFSLLNRYGTNTLLYLVPAEPGQRSGTVELLAPGVMRGYVDDFVIAADPTIKDHAAWLRIAVNAWLLDKRHNASFRKA
jgi:hypothetical protein